MVNLLHTLLVDASFEKTITIDTTSVVLLAGARQPIQVSAYGAQTIIPYIAF